MARLIAFLISMLSVFGTTAFAEELFVYSVTVNNIGPAFVEHDLWPKALARFLTANQLQGQCVDLQRDSNGRTVHVLLKRNIDRLILS